MTILSGLKKMKTKEILSISAFICAVIIGFCALWIPPMGVIDPSVLWFTAQLLCFVAGLLGINFNIDSLKHTASTTKEVEKR